MSTVTERCRSCIYYRTNSTGHSCVPSCDFILIEGYRRGCPAGDACDKYTRSLRSLNRGMTRLPVDERMVFDLYVDGMTDNEIADVLGVSAKAISDWRRRRDLRAQHSKKGGGKK